MFLSCQTGIDFLSPVQKSKALNTPSQYYSAIKKKEIVPFKKEEISMYDKNHYNIVK